MAKTAYDFKKSKKSKSKIKIEIKIEIIEIKIEIKIKIKMVSTKPIVLDSYIGGFFFSKKSSIALPP